MCAKRNTEPNTTRPRPLAVYFLSVTDPRKEHNKAHRLIDVIMVAICAVIAGCDSWVEIEQFGLERQAWFGTFLALPNGIPSHDTFGRVFSLIDPKQFQASFAEWMRSVSKATGGQVVAIDGKTSRRTFGKLTRALHLVSAFASANGVALGQTATDRKSNEITAIPELLKLLDITGCLVTTDALGCQADIAAEIVDRGGDYLLAVKGNQGLLFRDITACFADPRRARDTHTSEHKGHGRIETRTCEVMDGPMVLAQIRHRNNWPELKSIAKVTATRVVKATGEATEQTRHYICSLQHPSAERIQAAVRAHWGIENQLHWVLDMAMREDDSRIRTDHAPANVAVLRHIALNLIRGDKDRKVGIKISQHKAGWSTKYLEHLLGW